MSNFAPSLFGESTLTVIIGLLPSSEVETHARRETPGAAARAVGALALGASPLTGRARAGRGGRLRGPLPFRLAGGAGRLRQAAAPGRSGSGTACSLPACPWRRRPSWSHAPPVAPALRAARSTTVHDGIRGSSWASFRRRRW